DSNVSTLTKEIHDIIPSFTIFEGLSLWYELAETENNSIKNIFVFKSLNIKTLPIIVNEIYKKHNIIISESINIKVINKYLESNHVDNIITVENLKFYNKNINVQNVFFPIPN
ncbi:MAG: hypothetical protein ACRC6Z_07640, partial [Cetobacterium sp.]